MYLMGEFGRPAGAALAIEALKAQGFGPADLEVFSTEPVELDPGLLDYPSRMSLIAVAGAVTLGVLATAFVAYTQHDFPLITGGMPLFSFWATGVISYEMTMLGAIGATFLMFLWESGLFRRDRSAPVPLVSPGRIHLRVRCQPERVSSAGECLYRAGAARVERLP